MSFDKIISKHLKNSSYSTERLTELFNDDIIKYVYIPEKMGGTENFVSYQLDDYGLRNPHNLKHSQVNLITLGCSQTWGFGLEVQHTWVTNLANLLNVTHINLAFPGSSIYAQVQSFFAYVKKHGKPKTVAAHFPEFTRLRLPLLGGTFEDNRSESPPEFSVYDLVPPSELSHPLPKYSKQPHKVYDVFPPEAFYYINIQAINTLQSYCSSENIKFVWNTWDFPTFRFIEEAAKVKKLTNLTKNFLFQIDAHTTCINSSHLSLKKENSKTFDYAADGKHHGIHASLHIAEKFYGSIV